MRLRIFLHPPECIVTLFPTLIIVVKKEVKSRDKDRYINEVSVKNFCKRYTTPFNTRTDVYRGPSKSSYF